MTHNNATALDARRRLLRERAFETWDDEYDAYSEQFDMYELSACSTKRPTQTGPLRRRFTDRAKCGDQLRSTLWRTRPLLKGLRP